MRKKYFFVLFLPVFISLQLFAGNKKVTTAIATSNYLWNYAWSNAATCTGLTVTIIKIDCCVNGTGGEATANAGGGTGKYTYSWTNGDTNRTITGLTAGTYDLTVTDSLGCTGTATVTLNILPYIISTVAGNGVQGFSGDNGQATAAEFSLLWEVSIDGAGNLYLADYGNDRIRKINTNGVISTFAGNGITGYSGDNGPATAAEINSPPGVWVDPSGNVYIADQQNSCIRKVNTNGIITTIAGNGTAGNSGDGGPATAAELAAPSGMLMDASGNIFIADAANQAIRKIDHSTGLISRFAGMYTPANYAGDGGPATAAELDDPDGLAIDATGNIYFSEFGNNCVRKVNTNGIISTVAGKGPSFAGYSGDNGPATAAKLDAPWNIALDNTGNLYIADHANARVRMVNTSGIITTIAGNGSLGYSGDGGFATKAKLWDPSGLALDPAGNVYIVDNAEDRVRELHACPYCGLRVADTVQTNPTCNGSNGSAFAIAYDGVPQFTYSWAPAGGNNSTAMNLSAGTYTVTATDSIGCRVASSITLTSSGVTANITGPDSICMGGDVTLTANGGTSYLWSDGSTSASVTATLTKDSTFTVTASDGGCNGMATFIVYVGTDQALCALQFYHGITPNGDGHNDFWQIDNIELFPGNIVEIYNRWGSMVWNANGYDNNKIVWKGQDNQNKPLPDGTYYYVVKMQSVTYKGWVQLTR